MPATGMSIAIPWKSSYARSAGLDTYKAYQKFAKFPKGDVHSHARLRVNGVVMNTDLWLEGGEVGGDAGDVEVHNGLLAFGAEEEGAVGVGVHEEVFGEDGGGRGMA